MGLAVDIGGLLLGGRTGDLDDRARHRALLRVLDVDVDAALEECLCRGRRGARESEHQRGKAGANHAARARGCGWTVH